MCDNCDKIFIRGDNKNLLRWHGHLFCSEECVVEFAKKGREKQFMSNNYIMLNGEKVELTDVQVKDLTAALQKSQKQKTPFDKVTPGEKFFSCGLWDVETYFNDSVARALVANVYEEANYFNDKDFARQVFLHQLLYRKLLKFAYENDCMDKSNWDGLTKHYFIAYRTELDAYDAAYCFDVKLPTVYFSSMRAANQAIEEVIKPFIEKYPKFRW